MQTTLELRWFVKGMPPETVKNWFKFQCPGELFPEIEVREDWYFYAHIENQNQLKLLGCHLTRDEEFNLKLRQGNLELKLQQQELGTHHFGNIDGRAIWEGNVEEWCKWTEKDLDRQSMLKSTSVITKNYGISVRKERQQRQIHHVKTELTLITIEDSLWWSIAFESIKDANNRQQNRDFNCVIDQACENYYGPKLSTNNSFGYSHWLLQLEKQLIQTVS